MDVFYESDYRVDSRDTDLFGHCRPSAILGFLQESATQAACALHFSREEMLEKYNAFWMLARIRFELKRPLLWDETLRIKTWHRGDRAAMMYREFDLFVGDEPVGQALSAWVLADQDTRKLTRLGGIKELENTDGGSLRRTDKLQKLKVPVDLALVGQRRMNYSDTDVNGHINNIRYADFACDALELEQAGRGQFVSSLRVSYLAECRAGETIDLLRGTHDGRLYAAGRGKEGKERFDAILTLDKLVE